MAKRHNSTLTGIEKSSRYHLAAKDIEAATFENALDLNPDLIEELLTISKRLSEIAQDLSLPEQRVDRSQMN